MNDAHPMIEAQRLTKYYGQKKAIADVSFELRRGEILGFLGPNGAGKTTTMKILTCFISPSTGTARVNGHDVFEASLEARRQTGYLPESAPLYTEMTVHEDLQFFAEMRGLPRSKRPKAIRRVVEICGLGEVVGHEIRELSKGYRQRVGLAQAMIHDPDIMVLDEPTSGLDPNQIVEIRSLIKELGREKTIILSTHNLSEVQATCSRVIIINRGKIAADGTVEELIGDESSGEGGMAKGVGRRHTIVTLSSDLDTVRQAIEGLPGVASAEAGQKLGGDETELNIFPQGNVDLRAELARAVVESGAPLLGLRQAEVNLENVFRQLTLGSDEKSARAARKKKAAAAEAKEEV